MQKMKQRFTEPSTYAGIAGAAQAIPAIIINPSNPLAWGALIASIMAILRAEASNE